MEQSKIIDTLETYQEVVAVFADEALAPAYKAPRGKNKNKSSGESRKDSEKRAKRCRTPVEDLPKTSVARSKEDKVSIPKTTQVPMRENGEGDTFTISATLDSK